MSSRRTNSATSRLRQDYVRLKRDPVPMVDAEPLPSNILEWHYVVSGPEQSPYAGGMYHGKLVFPAEFPFKPPAIYMMTPNGRFKTDMRLCLSISDYHPDTWNPAWSVSTILTGLLSFMLEQSPTLGSIETSDYEKRLYAAKSLDFNLKNKTFCELFPEKAEVCRVALGSKTKRRKGDAAASGADGSDADPQAKLRRQLERSQKAGQNAISAAFTNFLVIGGFAAFAFVAQYIIQNIASGAE